MMPVRLVLYPNPCYMRCVVKELYCILVCGWQGAQRHTSNKSDYSLNSLPTEIIPKTRYQLGHGDLTMVIE